MNETQFQGWVIDVAHRFGWRVWHVPMPVRPVGGGKFVPDHRGAGLPDLILIHTNPPRLLLAELKAKGGTLSDEQEEFLRLARGVAVEARRRTDDDFEANGEAPIGVYLWQQGQDEDAIERVLRSRVML